MNVTVSNSTDVICRGGVELPLKFDVNGTDIWDIFGWYCPTGNLNLGRPRKSLEN